MAVGGWLRKGDWNLRCRFLLRSLRLGRLRRLESFWLLCEFRYNGNKFFQAAPGGLKTLVP